MRKIARHQSTYAMAVMVLMMSSSVALAELISQVVPQTVAQGQRLGLQVTLGNADKLKVVRLYFKRGVDAQYNFVVLNPQGNGVFSAELPATGVDIKAIDYRVVTQSIDGNVYKSPVFSVPVSGVAPAAASQGFVNVFSEVPEPLTDKLGFKDNIRYTYNASQVTTASVGGAGAAGAAAAAGSQGTMGVVGWGAVGAATVGGATVATNSARESETKPAATAAAPSSDGASTDPAGDGFDLGEEIGVTGLVQCQPNFVALSTVVVNGSPDYRAVYQVSNGYIVQWARLDAANGTCLPFSPGQIGGGGATDGGRGLARTSGLVFPHCSEDDPVCSTELLPSGVWEILESFPCSGVNTQAYTCGQ